MKAFIVAALLVASVAGQSFDMFKYGQTGKDLLLNKKFLGQNELLMKKLGYPVTTNTMGLDNMMNIQDDLLFNNQQILTVDELFHTQLFKEYMTLPLFQKFIQYPVFQKYLGSIYFQKFMTVPAFKQYFAQPELFYKFILPIVQLFKYDNTFVDYTKIVNKNVLPFAADYDYTTTTTTDDLFTPITSVYNKDSIYYKSLLNKIYSNLYNIDDSIYMDSFLGKDLLMHKLLNKDQKLETIFTDKLIKDLLVKKNVDFELLKDLMITKKMNLDIDTTDLIKKILIQKMLVGDLTIPQQMITGDLLKEKMITKTNPIMFNKMMYGNMINTNKFDFNTMDKINLFDEMMTKKDLFNFDDVTKKTTLFDILTKKDLVMTDKILLQKILADKINQFDNINTVNTVIPKIFQEDVIPTNTFGRVPITMDKVMGVRTFDKQVIPEMMIKA